MKNICIGENWAAKFLDPEITPFQGSSQIFLYILETTGDPQISRILYAFEEGF